MSAPSTANPGLRSAGGTGWRTTWTDAMHIGQGFHRDTGKIADHGITFEKIDEPSWTCDPKAFMSCLETSSDYSNMLTAGGELSVEGWGVSAHASLSTAKHVELNTSTITGVISMHYLSEKIDMIDFSKHEVKLSEPAEDLLRHEGPEKFHAEYGTHFIGGYIKGGHFVGSFEINCSDSSLAQSMKAEISVGFKKAVVEAKASAEFEEKTTKRQGVTNTHGSYDCVGWKNEHPPKLGCSLKDLVEAHDGFNTQNGKILEACLRRYSDIDHYKSALSAYQVENQQETDPHLMFIEEENYGTLSSELNHEFMRIRYIAQMADGTNDPKLQQVTKDAKNTLRTYQRTLSPLSADVKTIRNNLKLLELFVIVWSSDAEATPLVPEKQRADFEAAKKLYYTLWRGDALEAALRDALPKPKPGAIPVQKEVGMGWTFNVSDGDLHIQYNNQDKLILRTDERKQQYDWVPIRHGDPVLIRCDKYNKFLMAGDDYNPPTAQRLERPATFYSDNDKGDWEKMRIVRRVM